MRGPTSGELSASLGLVKSGIYKHSESKEAIWNALLDRMIAYYGERFGSPEHLPELKVLVFDRPWNRECDFPNGNYQRCADWESIRRIVRGE